MERIQKIIASSTEYSRRKAEELIVAGRVTLNGVVVTELGTKADYSDEILIDGNVIAKNDFVYYILNKPLRVISSRSDEKGRTVITDLLDEKQKIYPVGRLDYFTSGLIILTNDGRLANGLMHPRYQIPKTYRAKVKGRISEVSVRKLTKGVEIDGYQTNGAKIRKVKYTDKTNTSTIEITISEGKNQQVRKMLEAVGNQVLTLKRIGYAFFDLYDEQLAVGSYRMLKIKEVQKLYNLIGDDLE